MKIFKTQASSGIEASMHPQKISPINVPWLLVSITIYRRFIHRHHIKNKMINGTYSLPCFVFVQQLPQKCWHLKWAHLFTKPDCLVSPSALLAWLLYFLPNTHACSSLWIFLSTDILQLSTFLRYLWVYITLVKNCIY